MTEPFYSVIEDNQDEHGQGEYLHQQVCADFQSAKAFLDAHPRCTHIDFWNGKRWIEHVESEMLV